MLKHPVDQPIAEATTDTADTASARIVEDRYFKLWEREQEHTKTRWNVTTFFVSISFAIFGFSLQTSNLTVPPIISHSVALAIYWFACLLFWRFNSFTHCLRAELQAMETSGQVAFKVQTRANQSMGGQYSEWLSTAYLLFYFGVVYAIAVTVLWWGRLG